MAHSPKEIEGLFYKIGDRCGIPNHILNMNEGQYKQIFIDVITELVNSKKL